MKEWSWLAVSVLLLALGIGTLFNYWSGSATIGLSWPLSGAGVTMSGSATGLGAAMGLLSILLGLIALLVSAVHAVLARFRARP